MFARTILAFVLMFAAWQPAAAQYGMRSLTGVVTDKRGNTLPGAVVQLVNKNDFTVRSYITAKDGRYYFNNLNGEIEYTVFVKYRKWRSETKTVSKFNSAEHPEVNLTIPID